MTKKEIILNNKPVAYFSGFGGIEIYYIEYSLNDYIYFTSNSWNGSPRKIPHKARVYYNSNQPYFKYNGVRISIN